MAREPIKTKRLDGTGFNTTVKATKPVPLDEAALSSFKRRPNTASPTPMVVDNAAAPAPAPVIPESTDASATVDTPVVEAPAAPTAVDDKRSEQPAPKPRISSQQKPAPQKGKMHLVRPTRSTLPNTMHVTVRLRALKRHVPDLKELEMQGFPRSTVLNSAFNTLQTPVYEPQYVPQSSEPSAPVEWARRATLTVPVDVISAIEEQVIDGDKAPRTALILGQIEPAWFEALDSTIARLMK